MSKPRGRGMRAHPRSRGENHPRGQGHRSMRGSSPLTRGKRHAILAPVSRAGLIPAHAGKTSSTSNEFLTRRAHPRSRGENCGRTRGSRRPAGSSPLTRGKRCHRRRLSASSRLIPAHAGKTAASGGPTNPGGAHPRSRGENQVTVRTRVCRVGSSPLTRGKHRTHRLPSRRRGLIPAHAGKTRDGVLKSMSIGAHPRSRGENKS